MDDDDAPRPKQVKSLGAIVGIGDRRRVSIPRTRNEEAQEEDERKSSF